MKARYISMLISILLILILFPIVANASNELMGSLAQKVESKRLSGQTRIQTEIFSLT